MRESDPNSPCGEHESDGGQHDDRTRRRERVIIEVETTGPFVEMVRRLKDDDETVAEWIEGAAALRAQMVGYERHDYEVDVEVPAEAVEWARLRAEDARLRGHEDVRLMEYVNDHVVPAFQLPGESDE